MLTAEDGLRSDLGQRVVPHQEVRLGAKVQRDR